MENTPNLCLGILDAPFFQNEVGDDPGGPSVGEISGGFGSLADNPFEFGFLCGLKFDRPAGLGFTSEAYKTFALDFRPPAFDGGERNFHDFDDFVVTKATQDKIASLKSASCLGGKAV